MATVSSNTADLEIHINQGATFLLPIMWYEEESDGSQGDPIDLAGYSARMHIREWYDQEDPILELSSDDGDIALNNPTGSIDITIPDDKTAALDFNSALYDLELEDFTGDVVRLLEGVVVLNREVTK